MKTRQLPKPKDWTHQNQDICSLLQDETFSIEDNSVVNPKNSGKRYREENTGERRTRRRLEQSLAPSLFSSESFANIGTTHADKECDTKISKQNSLLSESFGDSFENNRANQKHEQRPKEWANSQGLSASRNNTKGRAGTETIGRNVRSVNHVDEAIEAIRNHDKQKQKELQDRRTAMEELAYESEEWEKELNKTRRLIEPQDEVHIDEQVVSLYDSEERKEHPIRGTSPVKLNDSPRQDITVSLGIAQPELEDSLLDDVYYQHSPKTNPQMAPKYSQNKPSNQTLSRNFSHASTISHASGHIVIPESIPESSNLLSPAREPSPANVPSNIDTEESLNEHKRAHTSSPSRSPPQSKASRHFRQELELTQVLDNTSEAEKGAGKDKQAYFASRTTKSPNATDKTCVQETNPYKVHQLPMLKSRLSCCTTDQLRSMLRLNKQRTTGRKVDLVDRVADCMVFGCLPKCPSCGFGYIRFSEEKQLFVCPGGFDPQLKQKVDCPSVFEAERVDRTPWSHVKLAL